MLLAEMWRFDERRSLRSTVDCMLERLQRTHEAGLEVRTVPMIWRSNPLSVQRENHDTEIAVSSRQAVICTGDKSLGFHRSGTNQLVMSKVWRQSGGELLTSFPAPRSPVFPAS